MSIEKTLANSPPSPVSPLAQCASLTRVGSDSSIGSIDSDLDLMVSTTCHAWTGAPKPGLAGVSIHAHPAALPPSPTRSTPSLPPFIDIERERDKAVAIATAWKPVDAITQHVRFGADICVQRARKDAPRGAADAFFRQVVLDLRHGGFSRAHIESLVDEGLQCPQGIAHAVRFFARAREQIETQVAADEAKSREIVARGACASLKGAHETTARVARPKDVGIYLQYFHAFALAHTGDDQKVDTAINLLKLIIEQRVAFADAYQLIGIICLQIKQDAERARSYFERAAVLAPKAASAQIWLGVTAQGQRRLHDAEVHYLKANALRQTVTAYYCLAELYTNTKMPVSPSHPLYETAGRLQHTVLQSKLILDDPEIDALQKYAAAKRADRAAESLAFFDVSWGIERAQIVAGYREQAWNLLQQQNAATVPPRRCAFFSSFDEPQWCKASASQPTTLVRRLSPAQAALRQQLLSYSEVREVEEPPPLTCDACRRATEASCTIHELGKES